MKTTLACLATAVVVFVATSWWWASYSEADDEELIAMVDEIDASCEGMGDSAEQAIELLHACKAELRELKP